MQPFQAFDEKLKECMLELQEFIFSPEKATILGVRIAGQSFVIDFFNRKILVSKQELIDTEGSELTPAGQCLLPLP